MEKRNELSLEARKASAGGGGGGGGLAGGGGGRGYERGRRWVRSNPQCISGRMAVTESEEKKKKTGVWARRGSMGVERGRRVGGAGVGWGGRAGVGGKGGGGGK